MKQSHISPIPILVTIILIITFIICVMVFFLLQRNPAAFHNDTIQNTQESTEENNLGISMSVSEASSTGITIECIQTGGAPRGELSTIWYVLRDENGYVHNLSNTGEAPSFEHPIEKESTTILTIDWSNEYGELPNGTYKLVLFVEDVYGEFTGKPFEEDYRTVMKYDPIFIIF